MHIEVELTLFQTITNSLISYAVKLFVHVEAELRWYWQFNCWLTVSNRKQQWNFILMVHKSLVTLFSPGISCSTSPWYHALHPLHSQSFSSAIGLLDAVQHLCSCTVQYFTNPLSLQREDSFITLDHNEIFTVLMQNFAFPPWKLMSLSLSLISQHCMVVMLSMMLWPSACGVTCGGDNGGAEARESPNTECGRANRKEETAIVVLRLWIRWVWPEQSAHAWLYHNNRNSCLSYG